MRMIHFCGKTDVGLVRQSNEDAYVLDSTLGFCLVADGMGGMAGGELASQMFAEAAQGTFASGILVTEKDRIETVQQIFWHANNTILKHVENNPHLKGMGCTAELIIFAENRYVIGHMGDSRTYQLRNGQLKQLTKDHSLVQEQLDQGLISDPQAAVHSLRNVILRAVGVEEDLQLDIIRGNIQAGDHYLLCSDGLTDLVENDDIKNILSSDLGLADKVEHLISEALSAGGKDNVTVVVVMVDS